MLIKSIDRLTQQIQENRIGFCEESKRLKEKNENRDEKVIEQSIDQTDYIRLFHKAFRIHLNSLSLIRLHKDPSIYISTPTAVPGESINKSVANGGYVKAYMMRNGLNSRTLQKMSRISSNSTKSLNKGKPFDCSFQQPTISSVPRIVTEPSAGNIESMGSPETYQQSSGMIAEELSQRSIKDVFQSPSLYSLTEPSAPFTIKQESVTDRLRKKTNRIYSKFSHRQGYLDLVSDKLKSDNLCKLRKKQGLAIPDLPIIPMITEHGPYLPAPENPDTQNIKFSVSQLNTLDSQRGTRILTATSRGLTSYFRDQSIIEKTDTNILTYPVKKAHTNQMDRLELKREVKPFCNAAILQPEGIL